MKSITVTLLLSISVISTHAQGEQQEDCNCPEYAQQYVAGFNARLTAGVQKFQDQNERYRAKVDSMKAALIKSGSWTDAEAAAFIAKAKTTDDGKALEDARRKAVFDLVEQMRSGNGNPRIAGGSKAEELRDTCLLEQAFMSKADVLYAATGRAWKLLESKVVAEVRAKNVVLP